MIMNSDNKKLLRLTRFILKFQNLYYVVDDNFLIIADNCTYLVFDMKFKLPNFNNYANIHIYVLHQNNNSL